MDLFDAAAQGDAGFLQGVFGLGDGETALFQFRFARGELRQTRLRRARQFVELDLQGLQLCAEAEKLVPAEA